MTPPDADPGVPIALTAGDPAGLGPELLARLIVEAEPHAGPLIVVSTREELETGLARSGIVADLEQVCGSSNVRLVEPAGEFPNVCGQVSAQAGGWALSALETSLALFRDGEIAGLVFGPLNKRSLHEAGMREVDEARWFENRVPGAMPASEVNISSAFWTSRVTSHVGLREVPDLVTRQSVLSATILLDEVLKGSGTAQPRIAVCALNPHAGEGGLFGSEEATAIEPGIVLARDRGVDVHGPFPCDTLFRRAFDGDFDGVVTMYHDQGQIALKTMAFDGGVTLEGGLALPICTPAHGTGFDIVGRQVAKLQSMRNALAVTRRLARAGEGFRHA